MIAFLAVPRRAGRAALTGLSLTFLAACADAPVSPGDEAVSLAPATRPSISLEQFAMVGGWTSSALSSKNASFQEGAVVAFQGQMTGLTVGRTYTVAISYDFTIGGHKAYDYLTTLPLSLTGLATSNFTIPLDTYTTANGQSPAAVMPGAGVIKVLGATPTGISAYSHTGSDTGNSTVSLTLTFTANTPNPTLWWGGHLASSDYWDAGNPNGALTIGSGNWQMRFGPVDGSKQTKAATIFASAVVSPI